MNQFQDGPFSRKIHRRIQRNTVIAWIVALVLLFLFVRPAWIEAAPAALLKKAASEVVELLLKKGGPKGAQELARLGGEKAVRELVEQAFKFGGETAVRRVLHYTSTHGAAALRALQPNPGRILQALDQLPTGQIGRALGVINNNPAAMSQLITQHGAAALQLSMRHAGVGMEIAQRLGQQGIQTALRLSTPQAIQLHRLTPQLARVAPAQRAEILEMITKAPARVLTFLEKHPRLLLTTAGVSVMIAYRDAIMGGNELVFDADGNPQITSSPGFLERALVQTLQTPAVEKALLILALLLGLALCIRILVGAILRILAYRRQVKTAQQMATGGIQAPHLPRSATN